MSDIQSQLQEIVPRAAIYKGTNKSIDSTVHKVEYVSKQLVTRVGSRTGQQRAEGTFSHLGKLFVGWEELVL